MKISALPDKEAFVPLKDRALLKLRRKIPMWKFVKHHHLSKSYSFPDFKKGLVFVNKIGKIADCLEHHPDIFLSYSKVTITTFDHKTNGLILLDFILADQIDKAAKSKR